MVDAGLLTELHERYGIAFHNPALLDEAFTHSSYANEHQDLGIHDNERLEFLGDAVLELTVSDYLYRKYPELPEGKLTRMRAEIVQTRSFSAFAKDANFDKYIKLGHGEEKSGARQRATLLEDLFEALIYLKHLMVLYIWIKVKMQLLNSYHKQSFLRLIPAFS